MKALAEPEADVLAMALLGFQSELPEEMAADLAPLCLAIIHKLDLKPAIARAVEKLQQGALALSEPDGKQQ
jgi:hypothetical protein